MRPRRSYKTVAALGVGVVAVAVTGSLSFAATPRVAIAGTKPAWVTSAKHVGQPAASKRVSVNVILPLRDVARAQSVGAAVSDPTNPSYGHYLTPAQFNAQFAPTSTQVGMVKRYLAGQGLTVTSTALGNRWVTASGTVAQVGKAFGTSVGSYSYRGQTSLAPSSTMTVPASIAPLIAGVTGLDTISLIHKRKSVKASPSSVASVPKAPAHQPAATPPPPQPCSTFWGQHTQKVPSTFGKTSLPTTPCGYGPQAIRKAYGISGAIAAGDTGRGITVAITDAYALPTMLSDVNQWSTEHGVPTMKPGQYTEVGTADPSTFDLQDECGGEVGWNEEEALDVEAVHGMAPGATIHYVGGNDCADGLDNAVNFIVQTHSADIVSNSWGSLGEPSANDPELLLEHSFFVQAQAEGIGFYFSAGDDGDDTVDGLASPAVDYPSSDPLVTAVGGTSLAVTQAGATLFQTSWGDTVDPVDFSTTPATLSEPLPGEFVFGTGGGTSTLKLVNSTTSQPTYQKGKVPSRFALKGGKLWRVTPDVALDADPETGYEVALTEPDPNNNNVPTFTEFVIGGTSLSTPLFAGFQALASQGRHVQIGFANPLLYSLPAGTFTDIVNPTTPIAFASESGSFVAVLGQDSSLVAIKGFDNTTGLGTPIGIRFLANEH
ncbi:MAG TPA: S53 family peptidase [Micromonosporaceae bacterium]|nr:S53 family peptidase [Micromonosporaceae bacterium]